MESWVNLGIPDCILSLNKQFALAELKVATVSGKVRLSAHQIAFHEAHADYPCFILVSHGQLRKREVWLYPAYRAKELSLSHLEPDVIVPDNASGWTKLEEALLFSLGDSP